MVVVEVIYYGFGHRKIITIWMSFSDALCEGNEYMQIVYVEYSISVE